VVSERTHVRYGRDQFLDTLIVDDDPSFPYELAKHVENSGDSISDPAIGGPV